jgi:hypothetical protein
MLITVHQNHGFFSRSSAPLPQRTINSDLIRELKETTLGNFGVNTNCRIVFRDGGTMKVVESVEEIRKMVNAGIRPTSVVNNS